MFDFFGDSIKYTKVSENILMYIYYVFTTQCIFMFIDKKVNTYFQDILSVLHVRTIKKVTKDRKSHLLKAIDSIANKEIDNHIHMHCYFPR